jgi:Ca2+-binding RTX toxin-like protein
MRQSAAIATLAIGGLFLAAPAYADVITGTDGADVLRGTAEGDFIQGFGGNDEIYGKRGQDDMRGGAGNDRLEVGLGRVNDGAGGRGDDVLLGGAKFDFFHGNAGDDRLYGGKGRTFDGLSGEGGHDRLVGRRGADGYSPDSGADTVVGGPGRDLVYLFADKISASGPTAPDTIDCGNGDDFVFYAGSERDANDNLIDCERVRPQTTRAEFRNMVSKIVPRAPLPH